MLAAEPLNRVGFQSCLNQLDTSTICTAVIIQKGNKKKLGSSKLKPSCNLDIANFLLNLKKDQCKAKGKKTKLLILCKGKHLHRLLFLKFRGNFKIFKRKNLSTSMFQVFFSVMDTRTVNAACD